MVKRGAEEESAPLGDSLSAEPRGKAKGAIVRPMVEWFTGVFGAAALAEALLDFDPRWGSALDLTRADLGLMPAGWYDERLASDLVERLVRFAEREMSEAEAVRAIGKLTVERSLGRMSRAVIEWFASPQASAVSAQLMWRLYHSVGWISASVEGCSMHAVGCWGSHGRTWCAVVGASSVHVVELMGLRDVHVARHTCNGGGARICEVTLAWREKT